MLKDMKEGLSSSRKPDITHVRLPFLVYTARPCEWGSVKYERANFLRPVSPEGYTGTPTAADFMRFRAYLRAGAAHLFEVLDALERHLAGDPQLQDVEGMKRAAYAVDTDVAPGSKHGASMLPHVAPVCSSLMMAITQAVECGLLPPDPGTPWDAKKGAEEPKTCSLASSLATLEHQSLAYNYHSDCAKERCSHAFPKRPEQAL